MDSVGLRKSWMTIPRKRLLRLICSLSYSISVMPRSHSSSSYAALLLRLGRHSLFFRGRVSATSAFRLTLASFCRRILGCEDYFLTTLSGTERKEAWCSFESCFCSLVRFLQKKLYERRWLWIACAIWDDDSSKLSLYSFILSNPFDSSRREFNCRWLAPTRQAGTWVLWVVIN